MKSLSSAEFGTNRPKSGSKLGHRDFLEFGSLVFF